ncbi:MAG: caspase family protein [Candidatus Amulumruptor caecigallinarius]|nr:caspase family protein [Candidatus Amulumruptor caecigallinarius]MCM1396822.1 caspase family protein [Candidatus Amulumruptor caecigallinarius]MCM1454234.1 caspase family protein [bacterium]
MKRQILFAATLLMASLWAMSADNVTEDNIRYTLRKDNTLQCAAADKSKLVDVVIPEIVRLKGIDYYVSMVENEGFRNCKNLRSIELPNSVKRIGINAFYDCANLETAVMPDDAEAAIFKGTYGYGRQGIFKGCVKLATVSGHEVPYPRYLVYDAFYNCSETPFYATILSEGSANLTAKTSVSAGFTQFASARLKKTVEDWQLRKPYETVAQWESRVNDTSRQTVIDETLATLRHEYVSGHSPRTVRGKLGDYVRDFEFFPVTLGGNLGTVYASVPAAEAAEFSRGWNNATLTPKYGVMDDNIAVLSCTFTVNGKEYQTVRSYAEDDFTAMAIGITPLAAVKDYELLAAADTSPKASAKTFTPDDVDLNIPRNAGVNDRTFAVIIGNENYQRVAPVDFAANDARVFAKYCEHTLGIPATNIRTYFDATYGDLVAAVRDINEISTAYQGDIKVMLYYAGHGVPDDSNRNAYILPVDASGSDMDACYPLNKLYDELGSLDAHQVVAFVDACFSGSLRGEGMLASARGIRLKPRDIQTTGNLVVISAASGDQSALPYDEKGHGIFTYYMLRKLNDSSGDISLGDLSDYVSEEVARQSVVVNRKLQTPTVKYSPALTDTWRDLKLR